MALAVSHLGKSCAERFHGIVKPAIGNLGNAAVLLLEFICDFVAVLRHGKAEHFPNGGKRANRCMHYFLMKHLISPFFQN